MVTVSLRINSISFVTNILLTNNNGLMCFIKKNEVVAWGSLNYIFRFIAKISNMFEKSSSIPKSHLQMTLLWEADLLAAVNQSFHKLKTANFCVITKTIILLVRYLT